jgi:hypothetical protein
LKRLFFLVEGQTEETFVNRVLGPHLWSFDKAPEVTRVVTKRVQGRRAFRGGIASYARVLDDLRRLLASSPDAVTTLFDYYALPRDFPGRDAAAKVRSCYERVEQVERAFAASVADPRFIPNLVLHEFEGLLFSAPRAISQVLLDAGSAAELEAIAAGFASPEEIDDGPDTHPSRRIERLLPAYEKPFHGPLVAEKIGVAGIRARCPHFDAWLERLESL